MIIPLSNIRLEPGEATIDHTLAGVAHIQKTIGDRTYTAWTEARHVRQNGTQLGCYAQVIRDPQSDQPARHLLHIDQHTVWEMEPEHFHQLQWVHDPPMQQNAVSQELINQFKTMFQGPTPWRPCCPFEPR